MWLYLRKVANQLTLLIWTQQKNVLEAGAAAAVTPGLEYEEEKNALIMTVFMEQPLALPGLLNMW